MWMPKQKDGKNWRVRFIAKTVEGDQHEGTKKFRVRQDAYNWIKEMQRVTFEVKKEHQIFTWFKATKPERISR